jgi:hypothetical protein
MKKIGYLAMSLAMVLSATCYASLPSNEITTGGEVVPFTSSVIPASAPSFTNQAVVPVAANLAGNQNIRIRRVSATSYLQEGNQSYPPSNVIDGDITTCWAEGAKGYGIMEGLSFDFDNAYTITGFNIWSGYQKSEELFRKNARPLAVRVAGIGYMEYHNLRDTMGMQRILLKRPIKSSHVLITIIEVVDGSPIQDTCISEISFF